MAIPKYDDLFNPLLRALHELGGSASISETEDKVAEILTLSDDDLNEIHGGNRTKLSYRLAWARNYLKRYGLLENSARGVWSLTSLGNETKSVDKAEVNKKVKSLDLTVEVADEVTVKGKVSLKQIVWQDEMLEILRKLPPADFERLCQRILREAGFIEVVVTGRSGDGGIDGRGILRVGGFLSFRVIFQCKRYKASVTSQEVREFKGTMSGRADKGLLITTGSFTRDAKAEAARDGSPPIDLVNGQQLVEKMKELGLGVKVKTEEVVETDQGWFENL
ncbi:MAG: Restriction endonuclease [Microgenomates group bacterium GW2011_GWA2_44_7]|nr:MAG: Restriction endonuclease [Microgenomates group bacterium GW2011_GWA2_44_7]